MPGPSLRTARLLLRRWRPEDLEPFAQLNADPRVMAHFPAPLSPLASAEAAARIDADFDRDGWGLFAVEVPGERPFAGFVGLARPRFEAAFTPCVEIGWRLAFDAQGRGYATEAALEVARFAFDDVGLDELVSFTVPHNLPSRRVMEKLGMHPAGGFEHPALPAGHPLRPHLLFRLSAETWRRR